MNHNIFSSLGGAPLLLLFTFAFAFGQEFRGSITGKVTDPNGAVVAGATVTVRNVETNVEATATTNDEGSYDFPVLNPGKYQLLVTKQGFKVESRPQIQLGVAAKLTIDAQLQTGSVAETVTVISTPALETGSVSTGSVITRQQISELPLTDGTAYQLATLAPGIVFTGNPGVGGSPTSNGNLAAFRANGGTGANNVTLDGSPNYAFDGGVGFSPPAEAVQEFKVQTNQFDAQQGYSASANVNVAIKSGGNDLHGALWYFNRDRSRTANAFFANLAGQDRPERTYHRVGGVVNGPVYIPKLYNGRNKTFFLFSYERLKNSEGGDAQFFTVPTAKMRTGDFSELLNQTIPIRIYDPTSGCHTPSNCTVTRTAFNNNIIASSMLNPTAVKIINFFPLPNVSGAGLTANYYSAAVRNSNYRGWLARIDHQISAQHRVYANYYHSFNPENRYNWAGTVNGVNPTLGFEYRTNDGGNIGYTATLSSSTIFDFKTSLNRFAQERRPGQTFDLAALGFSSAYVAATRGYSYLPRFDIFTYDAQRPIRSTLGSNRSDYNEGLLRPFYTFSAQPSVTHIFGNHTTHFGYDLRVLRENFASNGYQGGRFFFDGTYVTRATSTTSGTVTTANAETNRQAYGRDVAAFLLGYPVANSNSLIDTSGTNYSVQSVYHGFFFHDDFRATPKLTLNLGLRYERELGTTERFNRIVNGFDRSAPSPIEAAARAAYTTAYNANPSAFVLTPEQFRVVGGPIYASAERRATWDADQRNIQPRFGVAYQINEKTVLRGGIGIFMAPFRIETPIQYGFSASTSFVPTNDQGRTFVATLNNPFPSGLSDAPGSSLGLLARLGQDIGASDGPIIPGNRLNAKFTRMIAGVQRELPGQFVIEANYVWSHGYNLAVNRNLNFVPRQYLGADPTSADAANTFLSTTTNVTNPFRGLFNNIPALASSSFNTSQTLSRAQLLLPFPQFTNVWVQEYNGTNQYKALQVQVSKRFSRDLTLNATYTRSHLREKLSYLNASDPQLEARISPDDRPNRYTVAASYRPPLGRGRRIGKDMNRLLDAFVGGWQLNGTYEWQSGQPFNFTQNIYYPGDPTQLKAHTFEGDGQGHKYGVFECTTGCTNLPIFDTTGFVRLNSFGLRNFKSTYDNLRNMPYQAVNLSMTKNFEIGEGKRIQLRGEALNAFNHAYVIDFNLDPSNARFGFSGGVQRNLPRDIQLGVKFVF